MVLMTNIIYSTIIAMVMTSSFVPNFDILSRYADDYNFNIEESDIFYGTEEDVNLLCQLVYGEGNGLTDYEKSLIVWCVMNRVDDERFPNSIQEVITQKGQFYGYKINFPITKENLKIVYDVLLRYYNNLDGRTLPKDYLYFHGDGKHNYFRKEYKDKTYFTFSSYEPY